MYRELSWHKYDRCHSFSHKSWAPVPKDQLERSAGALYYRCQVYNQSFATMDLMRIVGSG